MCVYIIGFITESKATTITKNKSTMLQCLAEKQKYQATNEQKYRLTVVKKSVSITFGV